MMLEKSARRYRGKMNEPRKILKAVFFISLLAGIVGLVQFGYRIQAADYKAGTLNIAYEGDAIFNASDIAPGREIAKEISVLNVGDSPRSFLIATEDVSGKLSDVLEIEAREGNNILWSSSVRELSSIPTGSKVIFPLLSPGETKSVTLVAIYPSAAGNEYQGALSSFSIVLGAESTDTLGAQDLDYGDGEQAVQTVQAGPGETQALQAKNGPSTRGAEDESMQSCFWWWALLILFAAFLAYWSYYHRRKEVVFGWFWPIFAGALIYLLHWIIHDWYSPSAICEYFVYMQIGMLIIFYATQTLFARKSARGS